MCSAAADPLSACCRVYIEYGFAAPGWMTTEYVSVDASTVLPARTTCPQMLCMSPTRSMLAAVFFADTPSTCRVSLQSQFTSASLLLPPLQHPPTAHAQPTNLVRVARIWRAAFAAAGLDSKRVVVVATYEVPAWIPYLSSTFGANISQVDAVAVVGSYGE